MINATECSVRLADMDLAGHAVDWIQAFHEDVRASLEGTIVRLYAQGRSDQSLRLLWKTTLANERLLSACGAARTAMIGGLIA